ncbi:helix-turn-helix domain-containing protein [Pseudobacteriovorax antillogorgiicola]|uniref:Cro/C1-type HTH DNA-binding domain-containing protein n=1 Tax=Pseudobacteriovorax antillogorgiicola TaxID=1513793 RepID=A0A1Y6BAH5_9BACT|nr:helix-turn-helix transcriptional regulator [Pseudobacteriovorax antillogorgiicola]TCS57405.1 Cro/C1-type helix-turn-helix DNA-binding protein [Pseudobacteriovorax antillogorgiicola]SMF01548.1 Cro/C1-type HTH DNA-binding domain-containing protein [Pseudobacteriovorax antillogorgiicola]
MEFRSVALAVKRLLKGKDYTYKQLAAHLGLSESGVKKLLNGEDCSYNRLSQVAEFLNISVSDLLSVTESQQAQNIQLNPLVQDYFLQEPSAFLVYFCILYDKARVDDLQKRLKLSKAEIYRYLKQLDDFRLIEWQSNDRIVVKGELGGLLAGSDEFILTFKKRFAQRIHDEASHIDSSVDKLFILRYLYCTDETFFHLRKDITAVLQDYERNAQRDQRLFDRDQLKPRKFYIFGSTGRLY